MDTAITKVEFEIVGIAPIKMDRWHGLPDPKTPDGYKKQAEEKCYRNEKGEIGIPANAIKAAIRMASSEVGRKMEAKKNRQSVKAGIFIEPEILSLGRKDHDGIVEDVVTRGTSDKVTRVVTYRPHIKEWKVSGTMSLVMVTPDFVREALDLAGLRYGILSHRPEFGRFIVKKLVVIKQEGVKSRQK